MSKDYHEQMKQLATKILTEFCHTDGALLFMTFETYLVMKRRLSLPITEDDKKVSEYIDLIT